MPIFCAINSYNYSIIAHYVILLVVLTAEAISVDLIISRYLQN